MDELDEVDWYAVEDEELLEEEELSSPSDMVG